MNNSVNTNVDFFSNSDVNSVCEIIMIVFIMFLTYYILFDNTLFRERFYSTKEESTNSNNSIKPELSKKVSFENDNILEMTENIDPEYIPGLMNGENEYNPLLNNIETITNKKRKSKKNKMNTYLNSPELTGGDKSLFLMNKAGEENNKNYSCNLLGLDSDDMNDFKKNYYGMYAHQIECPKNCHMNKLGMKKCDLESDKGCNGVFTTDYNNPDVYALNYMALLNNNDRSCVTCTEKPISQSSIDDKKRVEQIKLTNANLSNTVNFENNVYLNSMGGETPVDKMAEIRSCVTGTCGLKDYGNSIKNVYDNLLNTPVYNDRKACDPYTLTGINENQLLGDNYASYN